MEVDSRADGNPLVQKQVFIDIMEILDSSWEDLVTDDIELSVRLCCGLNDCQVSVWDLESLQIWNDVTNVLDMATLDLLDLL